MLNPFNKPKIPAGNPIDTDNRKKDILAALVGDDASPREKIAQDMSNNLFDESKLEMIADLEFDRITLSNTILHLQIIKFAVWDRFCNVEDKDTCDNFLKTLEKITISYRRKGRTELVDMIVALLGNIAGALGMKQQQEKKGLFERW